jgi:signal transduction histidine kinase
MKKLRVLMVEDREDDMHLLLLHLKRGGYEPVYCRVDTAQAMLEQLRTQQWEMVLADYNMPDFSGLQALKIAQESGLDIPFIIVSGAIGEELAVAAMKAGAHDYLLKDKLARLVPAIDRALKDAAERSRLRQVEELRGELERELQQAKEQAELANKRKSRVLAFVAHEFKNPLKAIQTFADILEKKDDIATEHRLMINGISMACHHIRSLLDDILDIAPIEAGEIQLNYQTVSLVEVLDEVKVIMQESAKQRQIELLYENRIGPAYVHLDPRRLRQILINLLSNAIKYTHCEDTVKLCVELTNDDRWLRFRVQDHGPGIPEEELQSLFLDYYRVKNMLSKQNEGLGLGLALVKKLTECHQGEVSVESRLGEGTTFTVCLPKDVITSMDSIPVLL